MVQTVINILTISPYVTLIAVFLFISIVLSALDGLIDIAIGLSVLFTLIFTVAAIIHFLI